VDVILSVYSRLYCGGVIRSAVALGPKDPHIPGPVGHSSIPPISQRNDSASISCACGLDDECTSPSVALCGLACCGKHLSTGYSTAQCVQEADKGCGGGEGLVLVIQLVI